MRLRNVTCAVFMSALTIGSTMAADWEYGPDLNIPRSDFGAAVDGMGNIYVAGGQISWCPYESTDTVEMLLFDGTAYADHWVFLAPISSSRQDVRLVCDGAFIYAIGGILDDGETVATVERYDTTSDSPVWETIKPLNVARGAAGVTVDNCGRIYVLGGCVNETHEILSSVELYHPAHPELGWALLDAGLDQPRMNAGAVTDNQGRIYATGGQGEYGAHLTSVERYDPRDSEPSWIYVAPIIDPSSNNDHAAVGADGRIYVAGGWLPGYSSRAVRYDPLTDDWEALPALNAPRSNPELVLGEDRHIYVIGGDTSGCPDALASVEHFASWPPRRQYHAPW
ncbi:MAG: hypothetical protein JSV91_01595 [Phycisphaerales bacterium]|nr:MAG: hypothetical protein JSV91_01595 [Phycisphaerales bacterium]